MHPLVIVANRLPVDRGVDGQLRHAPGGLVAALSSVLTPGSHWVGWAGDEGGVDHDMQNEGLTLHSLSFSATELDQYYNGFANSVLWPLLHGALRPVKFQRSMWSAYWSANERFARRTAAVAPTRSTVWVHDYHLMLVPRMLRRLRPDLRIGTFMHIPFPSTRIFGALPWRQELIDGLLGSDLVAFQVGDDADNFIGAALRFAESAQSCGRGLRYDSRSVAVEALPISVDFAKWDALGRQADVDPTPFLHTSTGHHVFLGVDRLDYSKGIGQRLAAFGSLLDDGLLSPDSCRFVQVAVPTRPGALGYDEERRIVEDIVTDINQRHGAPGRADPVEYINAALDESELAQWYRRADTLVVTSLADGMNLVAKEYVASRVDLDGVLIVSEFAGAAHELDGAIVVNPYDLDETRRAMLSSISMPPAVRRQRMRRMRSTVRHNDVHAWARRFLTALHQPGPAVDRAARAMSVYRHPSSFLESAR